MHPNSVPAKGSRLGFRGAGPGAGLPPADPARRRLLSSMAALALAGCAAPSPPPGTVAPGGAPADSAGLPEGLASAQFALLGEVHDNPAGHALRLAWLREMTRTRRWAIAMEQFDAPSQARLDAARAGLDSRLDSIAPDRLPAAARELAEAGGFSFRGWDWRFYEPVVVLALARRLPLIAANAPVGSAASATDAAPPAGWSAADAEAMAAAIRDGHCGLLPERAVAAMVRAQIARDATMARTMADANGRTGLPVVLLAGNGHVRTDIGVPRHLAGLQPGAAALAVGIVERSPSADASVDAQGPFDRRVEIAPMPREDPCEALRRHFGSQGRARQ